MGMTPKLNQNKAFLLKTCLHCGGAYGPELYCRSKSLFFPDHYSPLCNQCIENILLENEFNWVVVDKFCQYLDIPFVPAQFEKLKETNGSKVFPIYASLFFEEEYKNLDWQTYFEEFRRLKEEKLIEDELPGIREENNRKLQEKWGPYSPEELVYLEQLLNGLLTTQNINGALQYDQALKVCKISLELDSRIREGGDFDKLLASYDKLVKTAEFTPKNTKNASDFDSVGELMKWMEKRGHITRFYDQVTRDIVDETIKNIQAWNQRLYTNDSSIADEINNRIEALKNVQKMENFYDTKQEFDIDEYENEGFEQLMNEEFKADVDV
jgi:hypothetical protein